MSFRNFKSIEMVQRQYNITYEELDFVELLPLTPSAAFQEEFEFSLRYLDILVSETARCESIIFPILRDVFKQHVATLAFWSHKPIAYDEVLAGIPDYLFSAKSRLGKTVLEKPLLVVVEAKKSDFEQGWGQCLATMIAAQKLNDNANLPVFGITTDGQSWQIGKLVRTTFTANRTIYTISNVEHLFGGLHYILSQAGQNIVPEDTSNAKRN